MAGRYKVYPEYKDSGVEWLERLPLGWKTMKVKFLLKDGSEGIKIGPFGSALKLEDMVEDGIRVYGQENVIKRDFTLGKRFISQEKYDDMKIYTVEAGDILVTMMGTSGKCQVVPENASLGIIDSHLLKLRVNSKIQPELFRLLVDEAQEIKNQISKQGKGSIMHGLNSSIVKELEFPLPSLEEQTQILSFLNHEIVNIDTLIAKQEKLIELLKEKRQAVISHVVTKGLNPDVSMKDSGVEWLGEVPEHWGISSLGYYAKLNTGATPDRSNISYWNGDIPWVKTGEVRYDTIYETEESISMLAVKDTAVKISPSGTLLMAMYGQGVTRGRVAILGIPATYNQACVAIEANNLINNEYLKMFFIAAYHAIRDGGNETSQMNLNADIVSKFKVTIPPNCEQRDIVKHLETTLPHFDKLIEKSENAIKLIQERKTALISAAVTGKIDVRDWKPVENNLVEVA